MLEAPADYHAMRLQITDVLGAKADRLVLDADALPEAIHWVVKESTRWSQDYEHQPHQEVEGWKE